MRNKFATEKKLVRLLSTVIPDETIFQKIESLITSETSCDFLVEFAINQQVASLIYSNLKCFGKQDLIPSDHFALLKEKYIAAYGWNVVIFDELKFVLELFRKEGIETVVLKGPMLLDTVYKDWGVRKTSDLDLLVKKDDMNRARRILHEHNYSSSSKTAMRKDGTPVSHHSAPMSRKRRPAIELHWTLRTNNQIIKIEIDEIWDRVKQGKIDKIDALFLSPEDTLLHLCVHHFYKLNTNITYREINDISAVIFRFKERLNWEQLLVNCHKYKLSHFVYAGLFFANEVIPDIIPSEILIALKSEFSPDYFDRLYMAQKVDQQVFSFSRRLSLAENFGNKLRHIFVSLFPSHEKLRNKYRLSQNSKKVYLLSVLHPVIAFFNRIIPVVFYFYLLCRKKSLLMLNKAGFPCPINPATDFNIE